MAGKFKILEHLKRGGFADVYRAMDVTSGQIVAVKVLCDPTPENCIRFQREASILWEQRDNPHVVNLLSGDLQTSPPYLILEFAELGSLQAYVSNRCDWQRVARWLYQTAYGLERIHQ